MKATRNITAPLLIVGMLLTGCSSTSPSKDAAQNPSALSTESATPKATTRAPSPTPIVQANDRGEIVKKVGEKAYIIDQDTSTETFSMRVTGFEFIKCENDSEKPVGDILAVSIEAKTTADFYGNVEVNGEPGLITFDAFNWSGFEPDGTRMNDLNSIAAQNCFYSNEKLMPMSMGKAEKAKGLVLLDVTSKSGEVVFDPFNNGGWVWSYPTK